MKSGGIEEALKNFGEQQNRSIDSINGSSNLIDFDKIRTVETSLADSAALSAADQEALAQLELKKRARLIQVSTEDNDVKVYLRRLGEAICLFGEDAADRRERLKFTLASLGDDGIQRAIARYNSCVASVGTGVISKAKEDYTDIENDKIWYHEGPPALKAARMWLTEFSLLRARRRLELSRSFYAGNPQALRKARLQEYHKRLRANLQPDSSQVGDSRPLAFCAFSPDGGLLATAGWSGLCRLWRVPGGQLELSLRGHSAPASCIAWYPGGEHDDCPVGLASCAHDGSVHLWRREGGQPYAEIQGHAPHRVSRVAFHPSGRFLATACHDWSWRLWDLRVRDEVLHQEGHSKPVFDVAFHPDGSLLLSGGLDAYGRVWDLRTGRCIMFLEGHQQGVVSVNWASNGYHMLTGSEDNTCRVWDLRQQSAIYTIPAHSSTVTTAKFQPGDSNFIVTSSFDKSVRVWGHPVWTPIKTLLGHEGKVMHADISPDSRFIASCAFDRHFKLWATGGSSTALISVSSAAIADANSAALSSDTEPVKEEKTDGK